MSAPYELHLALRYLRFHRGRTFISLITLISVAGVTVGTAALVIALSLMNGFVRDFKERILSGSAHLQVIDSTEPDAADVGPAIERIRGMKGVVAAAPVVFTHSMLVSEAGGQSAYAEIYGVVPHAQGNVLAADLATVDALDRLDAPGKSGRDGIVLGHTLARSLGVSEGDLLRVVIPKVTLTPFAPIPKSRMFEVVGTYTSTHFEQDSVRAYVSIAAARSLLGIGDRASWIEVRVADVSRLEAMKREIRQALGGPWVVIDLIERNQIFIKALNEEKLYLFLAIWLIVVVAALNIVSTLVLMVADKVKDIGTLTALGARPLGIASTFLVQGLIIGLVGTIAGLALGSGLSIWMDRFQVFPLDPNVYYLSHVRFLVSAADIVKAGLLAMGTSLVATLYPAWKAATLDPVEALRYE